MHQLHYEGSLYVRNKEFSNSFLKENQNEMMVIIWLLQRDILIVSSSAVDMYSDSA